jgi:DNA-binding XRE family transcriptional regulator
MRQIRIIGRELEYAKALGNTIRQTRIEGKVTRVCLAKRLGITVFKIDRIEAGEIEMQLTLLLDFASALCCAPSSLVAALDLV